MIEGEKKKALVIASVASMLDNFNRENINILLDKGYGVTIAANFHSMEDVNSQEKTGSFIKEMKEKGVRVVQINFARKLRNLRQQTESARQVGKLLEQRFDIVHCHSPICAAFTRLGYQKYRKKCGGKLVYTAHGFHFYKGAPFKNWSLYYPAEWLCSWWTDVLITINKEDYRRAKRSLHAKRTVYVPGVGVDMEKFKPDEAGREKKRAELGLKETDTMLLSVGELSKRKNHEAVIRALHGLDDPDAKYFICGMGELEGYLKKIIKELDLENQVELLGYRTDISGMLRAADMFVFPSLQEGLPVALMEAMASGLPCVVGRIRGNTDLITNEKCLVEAANAGEWKQMIEGMILSIRNGEKLYGEDNRRQIKKFGNLCVNRKMRQIYESIPERRE